VELAPLRTYGTQMKKYSIIRLGNEYVLGAGDRGVVKVASRRQAARLVSLAAALLNSQVFLPPDEVPTIAADAAIAEPGITPDPGNAPKVVTAPSEVP